MLFLAEIRIGGGLITILRDSPIGSSRQIGFQPKDGNESLKTIMSLIFFLYLLSKGFNFSSSGREDVDVRTLGNGKIAITLLD